MDITSSDDDVNITKISDDTDIYVRRDFTPPKPINIHLRSKCSEERCPHGKGLLFRSRISPSPVRRYKRRRRRSNLNKTTDTDFTEFEPDTSITDICDQNHLHYNHNQSYHSHYSHNHSLSTLAERDELYHQLEKRTLSQLKEAQQYERMKKTEEFQGRLYDKMREEEMMKEKPLKESTPKRTPRRSKRRSTKNHENSVCRNLSFLSTSFPEGPEINFDASPSKEDFISGSEFFQEFDRWTGSDYYSGSDTPTKLKESTRRLSILQPKNIYIAYSSDEELEEWRLQPKTDYTYCETQTYRVRVTPERTVGSPNMSRRDLHSNVPYTPSKKFSDHSHEIETNSNLNLRSRRVQRRNVNYSERGSTTIRGGLDAESDCETPSLPNRPIPYVKRGDRTSTITSTSSYTTIISNTQRDSNSAISTNNNEKLSLISRTTSWSLKQIVTIYTLIIHYAIQASSIFTKNKNQLSETILSSSNRRRHHLLDENDNGSEYGDSIKSNKSRITKTFYSRTTHRVVTTVEWYKEKVNKNPILWGYIPLALLMLFGLLGAYWWLSQSNNSLDNGDSLLVYSFSFLSESISSVVSSITDVIASICSSSVHGIMILFDWSTSSLSSVVLYIKDASFYTGSSLLGLCQMLYDVLLGMILYVVYFFYDIYLYICNFFIGLFNNDKITAEVSTEDVINSDETLNSDTVTEESSEEVEMVSIYESFSSILFGITSGVTSGLKNSYDIIEDYSIFCASATWKGCLYSISCVQNLLSNGISSINYVGQALLGYIWFSLDWMLTVPWSFIKSVAVFGIELCAHLGYWISWPFLILFDFILFVSSSMWNCVVVIPELCGAGATYFATIFNSPRKYETTEPTAGAKLAENKVAQISIEDKNMLIDDVVAKVLANSQLLEFRDKLNDEINDIKLKMANLDTITSEKQQLNERIDHLSASLEMLEEATEAESQRKSEMVGMKETVQQLKGSQEEIVNQILSCCKDKRLTLEDIESHFVKILPNYESADESKKADMKIWIQSYLATNQIKDKLANIQLNLNPSDGSSEDIKTTQSNLDETSDVLLNTILAKLSEDITTKLEVTSNNLTSFIVTKVESDTSQEKVNLKEEIQAALKVSVEQITADLLSKIKTGIISEIIDDRVKMAVQNSINGAIADISTAQLSSVEKMNVTIDQMLKEKLEIVKNELLQESFKESGHMSNYGTTGKHTTTVNLSTNMTSTNGDSGLVLDSDLNKEKVVEIVKELLNVYDADKTGMPDFALETAGGTIESIRCTETYKGTTALLSWALFTYSYSPNDPRNAIKPEINPGQCWAFSGSQGYLVIRLASVIIPTGFTLEHIPMSLSTAGNIDSAPKNFSVYGLNDIDHTSGVLLGDYVYQNNNQPLQYFPVSHQSEQSFSMVELIINSNHGNPRYTCLYRFRVHGIKQ